MFTTVLAIQLKRLCVSIFSALVVLSQSALSIEWHSFHRIDTLHVPHVAGGGAAASREEEIVLWTLLRQACCNVRRSKFRHKVKACIVNEMWSIRTSHARLWRIGNYRSLSCKVSRNYALSWVLVKKHLAVSQLSSRHLRPRPRADGWMRGQTMLSIQFITQTKGEMS